MSARPGEVNGITADTTIPDLLRAYPQVRPVLDRYGLRGCGGPLGPAERLDYFARVHGVGLDTLLSELHEARSHVAPARTASDAAARLDAMSRLADSIYRRFFKAGIVVVMTAGAVWGAILLLRLGLSGSFTALSIHEINAHGHAQIFGWVGLFVMGFAYQAFPRMNQTDLWRPDLANMSFYLMVFGVFARAVGEPLFRAPMFRELAVAANLAEVAAIALFVTIVLRTLLGCGKALRASDGFIMASLAFFLVQAVYDLGLLYATTMPDMTRARLLYLVSVYQVPLRDLQIHGFAMLMILGVGLRMFPAFFGFAAPRPGVVKPGLVLLVTAILGEAVLFVLMRRVGGPAPGLGLFVCMALLALTSIGLTARWGLFGRATEADRSVKFVRAAVAWLHVSMLLLLLTPLYTQSILPSVSGLSHSGARAAEIGFSHAYSGAVRHAITVGFISLMILGMAAKVVPTLNGVDHRRLGSLWPSFALVNTGCLLRVTFQIGTDFSAAAYHVAGVSGLLEVAGIASWGVHLWRIMAGRRPIMEPSSRPSRITAEDKIGDVVRWFPQTLGVFLDRGFKPLANPVLRRTVARTVSIRQAADQHGLDLESLLSELRAAAFDGRAATQAQRGCGSHPLPVLGSAVGRGG